jgi:ribosome modulation factor
LPPAARTTRRNMASSETCPCQTNMRISDWQSQITQKRKNICPYASAKIKPRLKENQALCVAQLWR